jgi:outer membrane protein assembly factor BamB
MPTPIRGKVQNILLLPCFLLLAVITSSCRFLEDLMGVGKSGPDDSRFIWKTPDATNWGQPWANDSVVFYLGRLHSVAAVRKQDGEILWSRQLPVETAFTAGFGGVAVGEMTLVGDRDLFALDANDGSTLWVFAPTNGEEVGRFVPILWAGRAFTGSSNGYVFAIHAQSGELQWSTKVGVNPRTVVYLGAVVEDVLPFTMTDFDVAPNGEPQGFVGAISTTTGHVLWTRPIPHHVDSNSPTASHKPVAVGSVVVAGARDGPVYAFDRSTGNLRWKYPPFSFPHVTNPALIRDIHSVAVCRGLVVIGSSSTEVAALSPETGAESWRTPLNTASADRVWCDDEQIYVMRPLGGLEVLNVQSGRRRWELRFPRYDFFYGCLSDGDRLFLGGSEGVYALRRN